MHRGPDPNFPWLGENDRISFPPPENSRHSSIVSWGGNLSPGMLLSAYEQGIFPWYSEDDPVIWHSPDPRFVIFPELFHVSKSMEKVLSRGEYSVTFNGDFEGVIRSCSEVYRPKQKGTWITEDIIVAYGELHRLGWACSSEAWLGEGLARELVGGCYGIRIGKAFFGESMFAKKNNASKAAFISLARKLFSEGTAFIDCQIPTDHLKTFGAVEVSRRDFLKLLRNTILPD